MLPSKKTHGYSLIELLVSMAIIAVAIVSFLTSLQNSKNYRVRSIERYRAQLVAESITDMVASLSNNDLLTRVANQTNNTNSFFTRDIPAFNWLRQWEQGDLITDVRFQINLTRANSPTRIPLPIQPPQTAAILPADAAEMSTYNKEIITEVSYRRQLGLPIETFQWRKVIPHE